MNSQPFQINLTVAWLWVVLGFLSGFALGANFHREDWLGGYASFRRRLIRLGHISFFGLGAVNLMFYFTVRFAGLPAHGLGVASWGFVIGAVSMPACCFIMAFHPKFRLLFLVPVLSLIIAGLATCWEIIKL